jgi:hypothetical protein
VPPNVSLCLFRVLQESLHTAVRYSRIRHFDARLRGTEVVSISSFVMKGLASMFSDAELGFRSRVSERDTQW